MIGRDEEIALLSRSWSDARSGAGLAVLITGAAGVGKSYLGAALARSIADEPHRLLSWQCSPHHSDSALRPIIDQIEREAGFERLDTAEQKIAKVGALLGAASTDEATGLLSGLLGLPIGGFAEFTPEFRKQKTRELLLARLDAIAAQAPALLLFEDVHWADPTTLELLTLLVDRVQHLPALLLITARPEFAPPRAMGSHIVDLTLDRLDRHDAIALAMRVAGGKRLPEAALEEILTRTDRVPLFVEELTKALLESGSLIETDDRYELAGPLPPNALPETLQDTLTARLSRLRHGKEVAQVGAAIGREFSHRVLAAALGREEDDLAQALDEIVRSELASRRGTGEDAVYTFKHTLVRDAAYNGMPHADRKAYHAEIATAILREEPDIAVTQPERLAHHYNEAEHLATALQFWSHASDLATRRSAAREAASHCGSAIALLPHVPDEQERLRLELELRIKLGNALIQFEGFRSPKAFESYARARAIARDLGRTEDYVQASIAQAATHFSRLHYHEGLAVLADVTGGTSGIAPAAAIHIDCLRGIAEFELGRFAQAWTAIEQGIARDDADPCTDARPVLGANPAVVLRSYANLLCACQGFIEQASDHARQAVKLAEARDHAFSLAWAESVLARSLLLEGRYAEVELLATRTIELCRRHGFAAREAACLLTRAAALVARGDTAVGVPELRDAVARWMAVAGSAVHTLAQAAGSLIDAGLHEDAEDFLLLGEEMHRESEAQALEAEFLRLRGNQLAAQGLAQDAEARLRQALAVAHAQGAHLFELRAATDLARLLHRQDLSAAGAAVLAPIHGWFTEGLETPDLQRAAAVLAVVTSAPAVPDAQQVS
jgi:tetratricopeptide (TPR) repeat protein